VIAGRTLQGWLDRADELGTEGRFFDAHEELEHAWNAAEGEAKTLFQGLIQIAAGLHRLRIHPEKTDGAFYLLDRGIEKLERTRALLTLDSLAALEAAVKDIRASGIAPAGLRFGLLHKSLPG
jgi:virulence-associated protein VapD